MAPSVATEPLPSVEFEQQDEGPSLNIQSSSHLRRQRDIHKICQLPLGHLGRR